MKNKIAVKDFPKVDFKKNKKPIGFLNKKIKCKQRISVALNHNEIENLKELSGLYSLYLQRFISQADILGMGIAIIKNSSPDQILSQYGDAIKKF